MRMRLRWEHGIARQLARESGADAPDFGQVLVANLAVSCLAAALWQWQGGDSPGTIADDTRRAFQTAIAPSSAPSSGPPASRNTTTRRPSTAKPRKESRRGPD
jgi:hypothetical protein